MVLTVASQQPDGAAIRLRAHATPVVCRIQHDQLLFDPRTVLPEEDAPLLAAIEASLKNAN